MSIDIVGAGPAGSTAAIFLSRSGFENIKLYEQSPNKRKPCGGALSQRLFEAHGGLLKDLELNVFRSIVLDINGKVLEFDFKKPIIKIVDRLELDRHLRSLAESEGVQLIKKSVEPRELKSDVVVDARGVEFKNRTYITRVALCRLKHRDLTFIYRPSMIGLGYFWIFPVNDNVADVGCDGFANTFNVPLNMVFEKFIKDIKAKPICSMGYPIDVNGKAKNLIKEADGKIIAKVGERAGLVNPLSGGGIYYAIKSSEIFAYHMKKNDVVSYEKDVKNEFSWEFAFCKRIMAVKKLLPNFLTSNLITYAIKRFCPDVDIERGRRIAWSSTPA